MSDLNQVCLSGRLTKDIELQQTKNGKLCARITLAVDRGKDQEAAFVPIVLWGKLAEFASEWWSRGKRANVTGSLKTGKYDKDGKTVYTWEVTAREVQIIDWPDKGIPNSQMMV